MKLLITTESYQILTNDSNSDIPSFTEYEMNYSNI